MKLLPLWLLLTILGQMTNGLPNERNNEVSKIGRVRKVPAAIDSKKLVREASNRNNAALREIFTGHEAVRHHSKSSKHKKHESHDHQDHRHKHSHKSHDHRSRLSHDHHDHESHDSHEHYSRSSHEHRDHERSDESHKHHSRRHHHRDHGHSHESHKHRSHRHDYENSLEVHDHHNRRHSHANSGEHHRHHKRSDSSADDHHDLLNSDSDEHLLARAGQANVVVREATAHENKSVKNTEIYSYLGQLTSELKSALNDAGILNAVDQQVKALGLNPSQAQKAVIENFKLALGLIKQHNTEDKERAERAIPITSYKKNHEKAVPREIGSKLFKRSIIATAYQHLRPASQNQPANPAAKNASAQNPSVKNSSAQDPLAENISAKNPSTENVPAQNNPSENPLTKNISAHNISAQDILEQNLPAQTSPAQNLPAQNSPLPNQNEPADHPPPSSIANVTAESQNSTPQPKVQDITVKHEALSPRILAVEPAIADGRKLVKAGASFLCINFKIACNAM